MKRIAVLVAPVLVFAFAPLPKASACPGGRCIAPLWHDPDAPADNPEFGLFQIGARWSSTTSGSTGATGTPITLRWGIVPDGTPMPTGNVAGESTDPSNLVAYLDGVFGAGPGGADLTQRPWFTYFDSSFNRWSQLAGLSYIFEPNDDGVSAGRTLGSWSGLAGVRADVRIGGHRLDGASNVLAYNYFPNNGDMVIDTTETSAISSATNDFRSFRNILMHEHGHGIGFSHVESNNSSQLMEPFLATSFDGPQFDDILAAHRNYGDVREKTGGNDTAATANVLGLLSAASTTLSIGNSAPSGVVTAIPGNAVDFVSIDDETDLDFFSFTLAETAVVTFELQPRGYSYNQGPQGGAQSLFNSQSNADLVLQILSPSGTLLRSINSTGLGGTERYQGPLVGGNYLLRVSTPTTDRVQMYRLGLTFNGPWSNVIPEPATAGVLAAGAPLLTRRRRSA